MYSVIMLILISLFIIWFALLKLKGEEKTFLQYICYIGYFYKLLIALIIFYILFEKGYEGFAFNDDRMYFDYSIILSNYWKSGLFVGPNYFASKWIFQEGYIYFCSIFNYIFGNSIFIPRLANILTSIISSIVLYKITKNIWSTKTANIATIIYTFLPDLSYWNSLQFKDTIVILLTLLTVYCTLIYIEKNNILYILYSFIVLIILSTIRYESVIILIFTLIIIIAYKLIFKIKKIRATHIISLFMIFMVLIIGYNSSNRKNKTTLEYLKNNITNDIVLSSLVPYYEERQNIDAGLISLGYIEKPKDLWKLPISMSMVLLVPFPFWPSGKYIPSDILSVLSLPFILMIPLIIISYTKRMIYIFGNYKSQSKELLIIFYLNLLWILKALFIYGSAVIRHKIELVPLFIMIMAASNNNRKYIFIKTILWGVPFSILMVFIWLFLKR